MTLTDIIALVALVVSIVVAYRSERSVKALRAEAGRHTVEEAKADLLEAMADCEAVLNDACTEIGALRATFDAEPEAVKAMLVNYTGLFTQYLPTLQAALASWTADRVAVQSWAGDLAFADLMREKARVHGDLRNFEHAAKQGYSLIGTFREKLGDARRYIASRTPNP